jgi:hypothetical protein
MLLQNKQTIERKDLEELPEVKEQRPPCIGYCMNSMFCQYRGTKCFQWYANRSAGYWTPYGDVLADLKPPKTPKNKSL